MIYDEIVNIESYQNLSQWFFFAAKFLKETNLQELPLGRTEIEGNHVFVNVMEVDTKEANQCDFETHKKYMDIQLDIEGIEQIHISTNRGEEVVAYKEEEDIAQCFCEESMKFVLGPGKFVVCMAEEPHKPTLSYQGSQRVKKCVIKVEVSQ